MSDVPADLVDLPDGYADSLADLKSRIQGVRRRAALAVNCEFAMYYWQIGRDILVMRAEQGWGEYVMGRLYKDLCAEPSQKERFERRAVAQLSRSAT